MGISLRDDVFLCIANRKIAVLDLRADRYFCLPERADRAIQALLTGVAHEDIDLDALTPLKNRHILVDAGQPSRPLAVTTFIKVARNLDIDTHHVPISDFLRALRCHAATAIRFKREPLQKILTPLMQARRNRSSSSFLNPERSAALAAFQATRRVLTAEDQCLKWSYALVKHLAHYDYYPNLVIGVRLMPFSMHAWVQADDVVLNDSVDQVAPYTPILVI